MDLAKRIVRDADAFFFFFGAGMSASSGAPTFRSTGGFWVDYPAYERLGMDFISLANPKTFYSNLDLAVGFYGHRLNLYNQLNPHSGYKLINNVIKSSALGGWVVTSNVDGHSQVAGIENVFECHGSIHKWQCSDYKCAREMGYFSAPECKVDEDTMLAKITSEHYCSCGLPKRPSILMFGDGSHYSDFFDSQSSKFRKYTYNLLDKKKVPKVAVIEIGAGEMIPTIRIEANRLACDFDTRVIRINMEKEQESHSNRAIHLQGDAELLLNDLLR